VSVALGAFFAGLVVGQSRFGAQAAADMAPVRDVFSALFFVSVGMLFDPGFVLREPLMVAAVLAVVMVLKPLAAWALVALMRGGARTAATVAVGLGQIGEFSFILAGLGLASGLLPRDGMDALIVAAIVSIALNPLAFRAVEHWLGPDRPPAPLPEPERLAPVVLAGHGPLGRRVARRCAEAGVPLTVIDDDAKSSRAPGRVFGDAGRAEVLQAAGIVQARVLVVADLPLAHKMRVCMQARQLQPRLVIVAAAEGDAEAAWLREFGAVVCEGLDAQSERLMLALRASL
jgi:monovalent cation:H+ antiporter-2, CPA2 family